MKESIIKNPPNNPVCVEVQKVWAVRLCGTGYNLSRPQADTVVFLGEKSLNEIAEQAASTFALEKYWIYRGTIDGETIAGSEHHETTRHFYKGSEVLSREEAVAGGGEELLQEMDDPNCSHIVRSVCRWDEFYPERGDTILDVEYPVELNSAILRAGKVTP